MINITFNDYNKQSFDYVIYNNRSNDTKNYGG